MRQANIGDWSPNQLMQFVLQRMRQERSSLPKSLDLEEVVANSKLIVADKLELSDAAVAYLQSLGLGGGGSPEIVAALPGSPSDGDEIYYQVDANTLWHLKYDAGATAPYQWLFLGGPWLHNSNGSAVTTASGSAVELGGGTPTITLPLAGIYEATYGAFAVHSAAGGQALIEPYYNGAGPVASAIAKFGVGDTSIAGSYPITASTAGNALKHRYRTNMATATFYGRWLTARPIRLG